MAFLDQPRECNHASGGVWSTVFDEGSFPFIALRYNAGMLRYLRPLRGEQTYKFCILTRDANPHYEVGIAETDEEIAKLLGCLRALKHDDLLAIALNVELPRKDRVSKIIGLAMIELGHGGSSQESWVPEFVHMSRQISDLEANDHDKQKKIDYLCEQLACERDRSAEQIVSQEAAAKFVLGSFEENAKFMEPNLPEPQFTPSDVDRERSVEAPADMKLPEPQSPKAFAEALLNGTSFNASLANKFWQLAQAAYHMGTENVVEGREMWEVIAVSEETNTKVIGRPLSNGELEIGFRGTISEDSAGKTSNRNWYSNLDTKCVALNLPGDVERSAVVHQGFQDAYLSVRQEVLKWMEKQVGMAKIKPNVRIAGHSLGGANATIAAVDIKRCGWPVVAVVTFGSPKVGLLSFVEMYERLGLNRCTARYVNDADPVPWVPPTLGFGYQHVVEHTSLGRAKPAAGFSISAHLMRGDGWSYWQTLRTTIEGAPAASGFFANRLTAAGAVKNAEQIVVAHNIQADVRRVKDDLTKLSAQIDVAGKHLESAVGDAVKEGWIYDYVLKLRARCMTLSQNLNVLEPWGGTLPPWMLELQREANVVYQQLGCLSRDLASPHVDLLAQLVVQTALFELYAMKDRQFPREYVLERVTRFQTEIPKALIPFQDLLAQHTDFLGCLASLAAAMNMTSGDNVKPKLTGTTSHSFSKFRHVMAKPMMAKAWQSTSSDEFRKILDDCGELLDNDEKEKRLESFTGCRQRLAKARTSDEFRKILDDYGELLDNDEKEGLLEAFKEMLKRRGKQILDGSGSWNFCGHDLNLAWVEAVAAALPAYNRHQIFLSSIMLNNEGCQVIAAALPHCVSLLRIDLSENDISDVGAQALAVAIADQRTSLMWLRLCDNAISDVGAEALRKAWETAGKDPGNLLLA